MLAFCCWGDGPGDPAGWMIMSWCEANRVDYLFGLAKNERLVAEITAELAAAEEDSKATGQPARRFH